MKNETTTNETEMNIKLVKIEVNDIDTDNETWENPGGSVFIKVNDKTVQIIIHPCGELDFEGDVTSEEESDAVMDFFYSNKEVNDTFPGDEFE